LIREAKDLFNENYKPLKRKIEKDTRNGRSPMLVLW
jgi:hypothetical protein